MNSAQQKQPKKSTPSGSGQTAAKPKTRRSTTKASATNRAKKQKTAKSPRAQGSASAAPSGSPAPKTKKSRTQSRSGTDRSEAKSKPRRLAAKALANSAAHIKKMDPAPPRRAQGSASSVPTGSVDDGSPLGVGATRDTIVIGAPIAPHQSDITEPLSGVAGNDSSNWRSAHAAPTQTMTLWSPLAILMQQQSFMATIMLSIMDSQRNWARAFKR
jgi:hypothetical protein